MKFLLIFIITTLSFSTIAQNSDKMIVVIDPGHGGKDPGKLNGSKKMKQEKELNLLISMKLGNYIDQYLGHKIEVVYTRTKDSFISLEDRVRKANNLNASYFISIHCNSSVKPDVHGTETHLHNNKNKVSRELALEVEKQFKTRAGRHSRGVKQKK